MNALVAFGAALLAFRLAGLLARRWRATRRPELAAWAWALAAYAVAAAAIAWGEAAQWDGRAFRVYYATGALLTAPLLGIGSLLLAGVRRAAAFGLLYAGLAIGVAIAMPVHGLFAAHGLPAAHDHLAFVPARMLAIFANPLAVAAYLREMKFDIIHVHDLDLLPAALALMQWGDTWLSAERPPVLVTDEQGRPVLPLHLRSGGDEVSVETVRLVNELAQAVKMEDWMSETMDENL